MEKHNENGEAISPYSMETLHALETLGRDVRGVCRAMEGMEKPARLHKRLARARASLLALRKELAADHTFAIAQALIDTARLGIPAGTFGAVALAALAAALAVAIVYGLGL